MSGLFNLSALVQVPTENCTSAGPASAWSDRISVRGVGRVCRSHSGLPDEDLQGVRSPNILRIIFDAARCILGAYPMIIMCGIAGLRGCSAGPSQQRLSAGQMPSHTSERAE